jgi:NitT/TauT family transport system permease protein
MIPKIALAPLIIVWLGYGLGPNIVITFAISFFPVLLDTLRGLSEVEPDLLDLVRALKGSRWQVFTKVQLPESLPIADLSAPITCMNRRRSRQGNH